MAPEKKPRGVYAKLHAIMSELDYIPKDKRNDFHNYSYASEQAIKQAVHPLLVKHGVLVTMNALDHMMEGDITVIKYEAIFRDVDSGDCCEMCVYGSGQDKGDKGPYKALTGAIKYALTTTFLIPTGDDPEQGNGQQQTQVEPRRSPGQLPPPQDEPLGPHPGLAPDDPDQQPSCPECRSSMNLKPAGVAKSGKAYGAFYSCSQYPNCKGTMRVADWNPIQEVTGHADITAEEIPF